MEKPVEKKRKSVTLRLDVEVIEYFKNMAEEIGIPYQNLINFYLLDCAKNNRGLNVSLGG